MSGFVFTLKALVMIPPNNVATLRTSQIIVAFVAQVLVNNTMPSVIDVLGAAFIFLAAVAVTFEDQIYKFIVGCCPCYCCRPSVEQVEMPVVEDPRPQAPGRVRVVSISLS